MLKTPYRLLALSAGGILLSGVGLIGCNFHAVYTSLPLLFACFACVVTGGPGMYWASHVLRENVQNERWPEAVLAPLRKVSAHPLWRAGMLFLVAAMFVSLKQGRHHRSWFWAIFFLLQFQAQMSSALAQPRKVAASSGSLVDWATVAPLKSEHWGEGV